MYSRSHTQAKMHIYKIQQVETNCSNCNGNARKEDLQLIMHETNIKIYNINKNITKI